MSGRRLLVVTTVHHADDNRIREKLIRTLARDWRVTYLTRGPPPSDRDGLLWLPLRGSRLWRNMVATAHLLLGRYDVAVLHDPETLPAGWLAAVVRRRRVVFDVHENIPAQIATKEWVPLRRLVAWISARMLRIAEGSLSITLAEAGYAGLFRNQHPVFPNFPALGSLPDPAPLPEDIVVYVGDITRQRGADLAVEAAAAAQPAGGLLMVGPCSDDLAAELTELAARLGLALTLTGRLPHGEAMRTLAGARLALAPLQDLPNYHDSLPTKVLEYLAMGVPVVASDLPGTRRVVGGFPGVQLIDPGDRSAWADAVREGFHDEQLLASARFGAEQIRAEFGWPDEAVRAFYASR